MEQRGSVTLGVMQHMALESQTLTNDKMRSKVERLASELIAKPPSVFWDAK